MLIITILLTACSKQVAVDSPVTSITGENVYHSDPTAIAVLNGIYSNMSGEGITSGGFTSTSFYGGLSSDELTLYSGSSNIAYKAYYMNDLSSSNTQNRELWRKAYPYIYTVNAAIEGISSAKNLTPAIKQQLLGEAKFIRAFSYFYLVNCYGDVPLVLTTNSEANANIARTDIAQVWRQIILDLYEAINLLNTDYPSVNLITTTSERVRPTKWAATALLARAHLYTSNWAGADSAASAVINNIALYDTVPLADVFLKNSKEAIWQLQPVLANQNTQDAMTFILTGAPNSSRPVYISTFLINAFKVGDARRTTWIGTRTSGAITYNYPLKYKVSAIANTTPPTPPSEYNMVLRLAEQYLIRAEARAQLDDISGAKDDLNIIRKRARLANTLATNKTEVLDAILKEKQLELFSEWGHRWFDLKRTDKVDEVMSVVTVQKKGTWSSFKKVYPIPIGEIITNKNLKQNDHY